MKRIAILLLICTTCLQAFATEQTSNSAFEIGSKSAQGMDIQFTLPDFEIVQETATGIVYDKIKLPDSGLLAEVGMPELPVLSTMIAIPNRGRAYVEVIDSQTKVVEQIIPFPAQNENTNPRDLVVNRACYEGSQVYPQEALLYGEPQILRDFRLISVQVQPFSWDSATHQLIVRDQMTLRVSFTDEPGSNELEDSPRNISAGFDKIYQSMILNYNDFRPNATQIAQTPPRIIIIYGHYTDAFFQQKLNDFAFWKRQKGADVRMVSTVTTGMSNASIKAYLQGMYNDTITRPDYIVFVGDVAGLFSVPTYNTNGIGDYPYQMLAGNDQLGDCFLGRISAEDTLQLDVIFSKIYAYEKTLDMATAGYLNRMLVISDSNHNGISTTYLNRYIMELAWTFNPDIAFPQMEGDNIPAFINNSISTGVGFFYSRQYIGMDGWSPVGSSLTNVNKLCHAVLMAVSTGSFDGTSTTENFIRVGTTEAPTGAVTAIGEYASGSHTQHLNCLTGAIADGIYARGMRTMGEALLYSKLYMSEIYGNTQPAAVISNTQWCNLMGDPTMEVYIARPHTFLTNAPETMVLGTSNLDLNIQAENGATVSNACVTVCQGNTILARTYSDESGYAHLHLSTGLADSTTIITVSKHDFKALQHVIDVDAAGSLVAGESLYDDDSQGSSIGNGDYSPNGGERLEVLFSVKNTTGAWKYNVNGYVSSDDPYITILDSLLTFGTVGPGLTVFSSVQVLIDISPSCPERAYLRLALHLTDNTNATYVVPTDMLVTNAALHYVANQVVDTNNQVPDPGETVTLYATVENNGAVAVSNVSGRLYSLNSLVTIEDDLAYFGYIDANAQATCTTNGFILTCRAEILPGMQIPMRLELTNPAGYQQRIDFKLDIGIVSVTCPFGPDNYGYIILDDGDTSFPGCPVYEWVGITPAEGGAGTNLNLSDPHGVDEGDGTSAISLATVELPFTFRFYGVDYTQTTVCTNGFIAMGATQDACFRNYRLPGAFGPGAMIAPFWDDLATGPGAGVYTWSDPDNHRYIVEWYHMRNGYQPSSLETFQVLLYDPAYYPTNYGDGPIKIQYYTFNNVDNGTGSTEHGLYSTIGIQDQYHLNGLQYSFNNIYPTAASPLGSGRALLITNAPGEQVGIDDQFEDESLSPRVTALYPNYPNPFNPSTTLSYSLAKAAVVSLNIYNTKGQLIKTLVNQNQPAGLHKVVWNGTDNYGNPVSSGIYFFKVGAGKFSSTRKMIMLK